jgi:hypothetical protein
MPLFHDKRLHLVIEPNYPLAARIRAFEVADQDTADPEPTENKTFKVRNTFWSWRYRRWVQVWEEDGKIGWGCQGDGNSVTLMLSTLMASEAWGIEQEATALNLLATLVNHHQFKQYMLTGMLMERSKRSNVLYLFRRLRPTVALSVRDTPRILCTLCMHPIGYYDDSWAGAMAPTDDVIAHLMLMRGDEHMFWRRCNQHPTFVQEAGL